jgi:hypothetical protein
VNQTAGTLFIFIPSTVLSASSGFFASNQKLPHSVRPDHILLFLIKGKTSL